MTSRGRTGTAVSLLTFGRRRCSAAVRVSVALSIAVAAACAAGCSTKGDDEAVEGIATVLSVAREMEARQFRVAVVNSENHRTDGWEEYLGREWGDADEVQRLRALAGYVKTEFPFWSAVALQELYYERDRVFDVASGGIWVDLLDLDISGCGKAAACFASKLGSGHINAQRHAVGLVADSETWELVLWPPVPFGSPLCWGGSACQATHAVRWARLGEKRNGIIWRTAVGVRLRNKYSGITVPFWATHISATDDQPRQRDELRDLVELIDESYVAGDMAPVVAGDFNCGSWNEMTRGVITEGFREASGVNGVLLVFVGRPENFPAAPGVWTADPWPDPGAGIAGLRGWIDVRGEYLGRYDDESLYQWTDHPMATVTLTANLDPTSEEAAWPNPASTVNGCWAFSD